MTSVVALESWANLLQSLGILKPKQHPRLSGRAGAIAKQRKPMQLEVSHSLVKRTLAAAALLILSACAATPEATPERNEEAKRFDAVTRDSVVYVYRPDRGTGAAEATLWANGRLVGTSLPQTFFRVIVLPGRTVMHTSGSDTGRIEFDTRGNDVTYVEMQTLNEQSPVTRFRIMSAEEAQAAIRGCCTMLELWRPGQPRLFW